MSACSISLCPWKYNLASSSLCLFKTFSQRSHPNSEPCFLSFHFTTHYPGCEEQTVFRVEWERETRRGTLRDREREKMGKSRNKWKKTKTEGMNEWLKESENSYSLKQTASWAFNEWWEERWAGDNQTRMSLFQPGTRERKTLQIYVSQEVPQICGSHSPSPQLNCMLWLLINSQYNFLCAHLNVCLYVFTNICKPVWPYGMCLSDSFCRREKNFQKDNKLN